MAVAMKTARRCPSVRRVLMKKLICLVAGIALAVLTMSAPRRLRPSRPFGYAKCAHFCCWHYCRNMPRASKVRSSALTPETTFPRPWFRRARCRRVTYLHYAVGLDKGFDVVAIPAGEWRIGHACGRRSARHPGDWSSLKKVIAVTRRPANFASPPRAPGYPHARGIRQAASTSIRTSVHQCSNPSIICRRCGAGSRIDLHGRAIRRRYCR